MTWRVEKLSRHDHLLATYKESAVIRQLKLSTVAQQHLKSIKEYTVRNYSLDQWVRYKQSLLYGLELICDNPNIGMERSRPLKDRSNLSSRFCSGCCSASHIARLFANQCQFTPQFTLIVGQSGCNRNTP